VYKKKNCYASTKKDVFFVAKVKVHIVYLCCSWFNNNVRCSYKITYKKIGNHEMSNRKTKKRNDEK
jgi:hypothetical protein